MWPNDKDDMVCVIVQVSDADVQGVTSQDTTSATVAGKAA